MQILEGYKTVIGMIIMGLSAAVTYAGYPEIGQAFETFAFGILAVGIGGKIAKINK